MMPSRFNDDFDSRTHGQSPLTLASEEVIGVVCCGKRGRIVRCIVHQQCCWRGPIKAALNNPRS